MKTKDKNRRTSIKKEYGYSLVEVLIAMAVTLIILAAAFGVFKTMSDSGSAATKVADIENDMQASINLMRLDLYKVGGDGIIPEEMAMLGNWQNNRCIRSNSIINDCDAPMDGDVVLLKGTHDTGTGYVLDGVTPGLVNGHSAMSVVYIDEFARGVNATLKTADSLEVKTGDAKNVRKFSTIRQGDLVFLRKSFKIALMHVTGKSGNTLSFSSDPTGMNQSLFAGLGANPDDDVEIQLIRRVTYYLDVSPTEGNPAWLMRQINFRPAVQLIPGVLGFQLTYELIDRAAGSVQEINVAPGTRGSRQAGTKYSIDVDVQNDKQYFDDNPRKTTDIRRVNINIWADSMAAATQGSDKHVVIDQTARVALRGYGDFIEPDPCVEEPFLEGCPCWEISEDMKAGYQSLGDLLAAGCPNLCAIEMNDPAATKDSVLALGCPDPCTVNVWFTGCPCAVTLQDIKDGHATVGDLKAQGCPDVCSGDPFFPTCPCDLNPFSRECDYCWNDPWAPGCPCAINPNDSRCPINLDDQFGKCEYENADCTVARCSISCAQSQGNGNSCTLHMGSYPKGPEAPLSYEKHANKNPSWFASGVLKLGDKNYNNYIEDIVKNKNPPAYWLDFDDDGKGCNKSPCKGSTFPVPLLYGGPANCSPGAPCYGPNDNCDADGKNCTCKGAGSPAYYCYDDLYMCRKDASGKLVGIYRRGSDSSGNLFGGK